jgi:transcriptional regulator with XRE-family HTH domain
LAVCRKAGISRSRLSEIERGYITPPPEELVQIDFALDELIRTKRKMAAVAAAEGWPVPL